MSSATRLSKKTENRFLRIFYCVSEFGYLQYVPSAQYAQNI